MKNSMTITLLMVLFSTFVSAQQTDFQDSFLDQMTGKWILQPTPGNG